MYLLILFVSLSKLSIASNKSLEFNLLAAPVVTATLSDYNGFNVSCPSATDGSIDLDVNGGTTPYSFIWSNGETTEDVSNLASGAYTVTVTDGNGDVTTETYTLTEPAPIQTINSLVQNVTCYGLNNGSIDKTFAGGVIPYTFLWSDASVNEDLSNAFAGTYDVTVTDLNGCSAVFIGDIISQPDSIQLQAITTIDSCGRSVGTIDLAVLGGTQAFTFAWSNGEISEDILNLSAGTYTVTATDANLCVATDSFVVAGTSIPVIVTDSIKTAFCDGGNSGSVYISTTGATISTYLWSNNEVTEDITNLVAGTYTVTISDVNACTASVSFIVPGTSSPSISLDSTQNVLCNGDSNGSLFISVVSSSLTNTFEWSNGAVTEDLASVIAGTYTVTATDENGCFDVDSFVVSEPAILALSLNNSNNVSCFGGSNGAIDINVSGGTTDYSFSWSNGATTQNLSSILVGTYTVTVSDANLCSLLESFIITEPSALSVALANSTNVSCFGGTNGAIDVNVIGGTANYSFVWSNGATTQNVTALQAGTYTVTVTDANLCTTSDSYSITEPAALSVTLANSTNASCLGNANGAIDVNVTGGATNYSFLWSNGASSQNISALQAGTYTITITDANLCTTSDSYLITEPATLLVTLANSTNASCLGSTNGAIDVNVTGGTANYSFVWSNGATTQNVTALQAGTYTVTVTDANLCTTSDSYSITEPSALSVSLASSTNVSCFGGANGSINTNITGGTTNYSFLWSNGSTTQNVSSILAGTYTVTVTDANLCTTTDSYTIAEPTLLSVTLASSTNASCFGGANGSININVAGGTVNYSFLWSNGATTQNVTALQAGTYIVTVTDANLCSTTGSYSITGPNAFSVSLSNSNNVSCFGGANGAIDVTPTGGTPGYTYLWSNGATTQDISGIVSGNYTVTITDANLCTINSTYLLSQPAAPLSLTLVNTNNVSCFGGTNGSVDITPNGGTLNYTYHWSNGASSQDISGVGMGTYTVTVTDANLCTTTNAYSISQPTVLSISLVNSTNVTCFGGTNGAIDITPLGGTTGYSYKWSNGATSQDLNGINFGTYTVTVTDANLCAQSNSYSLSQPSVVSISLVNSSNVSCFGGNNGAVNITPNGGTTGYTYNWSNGASTQDLTGLTAGTYTITVTDVNSCTASNFYTITQPTALAVTLTSSSSVSCFAGNNGMVNITPSGGAGSYSYNWSNGATSQDLNNVPAGSYSLTLTDANSCTRNNSFTVIQPAVLAIGLVNKADVSCFGGSDGELKINVSGGVGSYTYNWSNGASTQNINSIIAGNYTVTVTDQNICSKSNGYSIVQPPNIQVNVTTQSAACGLLNGSASINCSGGTGGFNFLWNTGATSPTINGLAPNNYTVTVTDQNSCSKISNINISQVAGPDLINDSIRNVSCFGLNNGAIYNSTSGGTPPYIYLWNNLVLTEDLSNVGAGTYTLVVTDLLLCTDTIVATITQPAVLAATLSGSSSACGQNNGTANSSVTGGTAPYTYVWSNAQTTANISNLAPGTYTVTVTDVNLCTTTQSRTVGTLSAPSLVIDSVKNVKCFGQANGSIYTTTFGGNGPLTYVWSPGGSGVQDLTGLVIGNYTLIVTDSVNCKDTITSAITQPAVLAATLSGSSSACSQNNGTANSSVTGGTSPYTYVWSNAQTTPNISNLAPGTYTVTVTDANLCTTTQSRTVGTLSAPSLVIDSVKNVKCFGQANGAIYTTTFGGNGPMTYVWSPGGSTVQDLTGLAIGNYTLIVTDSVNCKDTVTSAITQPAVLAATLSGSSSACSQNNGTANSSVSGGTTPYTYVWNNAQTTANISNLAPGTYTVTVSDANLCTTTQSRTVGTLSAPSLVVDSVRNVKCFGQANGAIYTTTFGGNGPLTYVWSPGGSAVQDLTGLAIGNYTLIVTDSVNCKDTITSAITQPAVLAATLSGSSSACSQNNGTANSSVTGGTSPYTYVWSNAQTTVNISNLAPGTYTVTVTDANLCTTTQSRTVGTLSAPSLVVDSVRNVKCFGQANGAIYTTTFGGNGPLTYVWSPVGSTVQDLTGLAIGNYTLIVTDSVNCKDTVTSAITQPAVLTATLSGSSSACSQNNGTANSSVSGGTTPYTYVWNNAQTTANISNLAPGTYTVTVSDANLCTTTQSRTVGTLSAPSLVVDSVRNVKCFGQANGAIYTTTFGGNGPLTYVWSPGGSGVQDLTGLVIGNYTLIVTDSVNCKDTITSAITQPAVLAVNLTPAPSACGQNNGSVTSVVTGGTGTYNYLWSNSQTSTSISNLAPATYTLTVTDSNLCNTTTSSVVGNITGGPVLAVDSIRNVKCFGQATGGAFIHSTGTATPFTFAWSNGAITEDIQNVLANSYTLTVTDTNNCSNSISVTITQPATAISATINSTAATCGNLNGTATTAASGGTPGYTYLWNTSATTPSISNLAPGNYTVTVTDANLCTIIKNITVNSTPAISVIVDSVKNVKCFNAANGEIYTTVSGGSGTITYQWTPVQPAVGDITNLGPGSYTLIVSDTNSCSDTVTAVITQPNQLVLSTTSVPERCGINNGSATAIVSGGTTGYSYLWNTTATTSGITNLSTNTYTVTVTDANLCTASATAFVDSLGSPVIITDSVVNVKCNAQGNGSIYITVTGGNGNLAYTWSPGINIQQDLLNVIAGNYTVTVSDTNFCSATQTFTITAPSAIVTTMSSTPSTCGLNNGTASVDVTGGNSTSYSYSWNTSAITDSISNLSFGTYTVTVTDFSGCTKVDSVVVDQDGAPSIVIDSIITVKCNGGSNGAIYTSTSGGNPQYTYQWSSPVTNTSDDNINIPAGTYTVTVTDSNGCKDTVSTTLNDPPAIQSAFTTTAATCNLNNGTATVNPSGGTGIYSYVWSTSATDTLNTITGLTDATYTVTITDNNNCSITSSVNVTRNAATSAVVDSIHNISCFNLTDGDIYITPSGGDGSYTYQWSFGGITTQDIENVSWGSYTVVVSDNSSCTFTIANIPITQNSALTATTSYSATGCGASTGTATVIPSGGTGPGTYTYLWSFNSLTTQTITGLSSGTYTVTVSDGNLCSFTTSVTVGTTSGPTLTIDSIVPVKCFGDTTGAVYISITGGASPYGYAWSNGKTTQDIINLAAGTYTVTATDDNFCVASLSATVNQNSLIVPNFNVVSASCGLANGVAVTNPTGGSGGYSYIWTGFPGNTTNVLTGSANTYPIRIIDNVGCFIDTSVTINNPNSPTVTLDSIVNLKCVGGTNGAVYVTVSGGTPGYTYSWQGTSPLQTTEDATNLPQGTYTFVVHDGANCTTSIPYTVDTLYSRINIAFTATDPTCGFNNGQVVAVPSGGNTANYSYAWSVAGSSSTINNLSAGSYTVTVTDASGCTKVAIATLSNITGASISFTDSSNVSCFGGSNGSITTSITGGTLPYTILWQDSVTTLNRTNIPTGNYTITVKDGNGCVSVRTIFIGQPSTLNVTALIPIRNNIYNVTCNGSFDGEIDLTVAGGTPFLNTGLPTYAYQWSISGATSSSVVGIPAGSYNVTITDSLGCANTSSYLLIEPPLLNAGTGGNISICGLDSTIISTLAPTYGIGKWSLISGTGVIVKVDSATTLVKNLGTGTNIFAWVVKDNFCSDTSLTLVTVKETVFSDAGIDQDICKSSLVLSAVPPQFGNGLWNILSPSTASIEDPIAANAAAANLSLGQNIFTWTVQNGNCTDIDTVVIEVLPQGECLEDIFMPTGFTPNGDGLNDLFVVRGLDDENCKISIFNRWGNLVYEKSNYLNDWDGKSKTNQDLPDGTYYVILSVPSRNTVLKSYIDLRR